MNNLISKVTLILLCTVFALFSCSDNDSEKKTVTVKYQILVGADQDYNRGLDGGGIEELYLYTKKEMDAVSKACDKEAWTITETAETEEAAIAACDKKAIAVFDEKLSAINAATASVKVKFEAKKAELLSKITVESGNVHVIYKNYGGILLKKDKEEDLLFKVIVKEGESFNFQAIGGEK